MIDAVVKMDVVALRRTQGDNLVKGDTEDTELKNALVDTIAKFSAMMSTIP